MINFIICENEKFYNQEYQDIIEHISMIFHIECKKHIFYDYNKDFFKIMKADLPGKIYILDIVMDSHKGTEIAAKIRKNDLKSLIIFVTAHYQKYSKVLLESKYMFLKYINKKGNYRKELEQVISSIILDLDKDHIIRVNKKDVTYMIETEDVLYLCVEDRKTKIVSDIYQPNSSKSLSYYEKRLPHNFYRSHKSCIVNLKKITSIDKKKRIIYFGKNIKTDLLSKKYLKELLDQIEKEHIL